MSPFDVRFEEVILGGSFDPPHLGHLTVLEELLDRHANRVRLLPAGQSPGKVTLLARETRVALARALIDALPSAGLKTRVSLDPREALETGPSYTVETLRALGREGLPLSRMAVCMGSDQLESLARWREPAEVLRLVVVLAVARAPGGLRRAEAAATQLRAQFGPQARILVVPTLAPELSSTQIRESFALHGAPPEGTVPEPVLALIRKLRLYGAET